MKGLPDHPNETFKRLNPEFYGKSVAERIRTSIPEPNLRRESQDRGVEASEECVRFRIVFTTYRKRLLDEGDNANSALKAIRDRVVTELDLPDDSPRWVDVHYHQIKSDVIQGTHILVQRIS